MKRRTGRGISLVGYLLFFLTIAATVTVAVFVYDFCAERSGGNRGLIAGVMLGTVALLSLVCTLLDMLRRRLMVERPVREILAVTDRLAAGDFSARFKLRHAYDRYDEYDLIAENLNRMAAELSKTEVLRTDFVSNVSHELKTPLAVIRNYAAALRDPKLPAELREKYAETLVETSERLTTLVGNVLRLNKLENQEILPEPEPVALGEMLRESVLGFEELFERKSLGLECDIVDAEIDSVPGYLEIVFQNLLSNAVKFTPEGGKITVSLRRIPGHVEVRVADTGVGIPPEVGAHIFEKFYQGDTSHAREGNGLGLALVKTVIDRLGGEIEVESAPGRGSVFTVRLRSER